MEQFKISLLDSVFKDDIEETDRLLKDFKKTHPGADVNSIKLGFFNMNLLNFANSLKMVKFLINKYRLDPEINYMYNSVSIENSSPIDNVVLSIKTNHPVMKIKEMSDILKFYKHSGYKINTGVCVCESFRLRIKKVIDEYEAFQFLKKIRIFLIDGVEEKGLYRILAQFLGEPPEVV